MNKYDIKIKCKFIGDEFHFSEVHGSMNATGPVQCQCITYFERDPLHSYIHEPQKDEIYFLTEPTPISTH